MKALLYEKFGGPEVLQVRELPAPVCRADGVVVRVRAAALGPGDCKARAGLLQDHVDINFPKIPGRYGCGDVVEVGEQVGSARVGEAVVFTAAHGESGSCAEFVRLSPARLAIKPRNLGYVETAAVIQAGVCAFTLLCEAGEVAPGDKVLVHGGAGSVGSACVELARHLGAQVTATCRDSSRALVEALGADRVVAFDREPFWRLISQQDVVVDLIGGDVHRHSYEVLTRGGRLVYLHAAPFEDRSATFGVRLLNAVIDNRRSVLEAAVALAEREVFTPRLENVFPLASAAEAHRMLEADGVRRGRIVIVVD
jgi:NADPH:quinone reductase-like Zn-dependent oxidoreductase